MIKAFDQIKDIVQRIDDERDVISLKVRLGDNGKVEMGKRDVADSTPPLF